MGWRKRRGIAFQTVAHTIFMIRTNGFRAWVLASRPQTLTGAIAPVLVGGTMAQCTAHKLVSDATVLFVLCLLFAVIMQIDANFVNDYYDFKKGTDREDRLGPERACAQGWITPKAMQCGIIICTVVASLVGLTIFWIQPLWELLAIGVACIIGCFLYTWKFSYLGLGDVLVLLFFGIVPVGFTYYVMTGGEWSLPLTIAGLSMGLVTDTLLMVNNYRDIAQDKLSGKKTIVVRLGQKAGLRLYLWLGVAATLLAMTTVSILFFRHESAIIGMPILGTFLGFHVQNYRKMKKLTGRKLNMVLKQTAVGIFLLAILLVLSLIINKYAM